MDEDIDSKDSSNNKELKYDIKAQRDGVTPLARSFSGHSQ